MSRPERMRRVDEAMKKVVSEAIPTLSDPRIGFVTVTAVETSRDLDHAKVWLSVLGSEAQRARTLEALEGCGRRPPGEDQPRVEAAPDPQLEFVYDRAVEHGVRLTHLIDELAPADDDDARE